MNTDIQEIQSLVETEASFIERLTTQISSVIVGQKYLIERLLMGILANGHILIEGVPGLAKTLSVQTLADAIQAKFQRLQFTPDLLPSDITGTEVYRPEDGSFKFQPGPVFHNLLLADEVNRAPAKVQSALLEAMAEHQVSVGRETFPLPELFLVMATQNPIEQEGTYPLPEAQLDRFLMRLSMGYPGREEELELLRTGGAEPELERLQPVVDSREVIEMQDLVAEVHVSETLLGYLIEVVEATRVHEALALGVSTRGCLAWQRSAQALALVRGRAFVLPDDLQETAESVLAHRLLHADPLVGDGWERSRAERAVIRSILETIPVPR